MANKKANIVICGAGITGVSAAYFLARSGIKDIVLVDERPPLSFTSDQSAECYRNWWGDPAMLGLIDRSIDLMEELAETSGNVFQMNRRGYLYITGDEASVPALKKRSELISKLGAGQLRTHTLMADTYHPVANDEIIGQSSGADLLLGTDIIQKHYPYISKKAVAALHARRAGWLSAQQLGMYLFEMASRLGVRFESARVSGVDVKHGQVTGVRLGTGKRIQSLIFVNAAGPYLKQVGQMLGVDLPVHTELHLKASIQDVQTVVTREAPLLIWNDPQRLPWTEDERAYLAADPETAWLTRLFPAGVHTRPEGSGESKNILMLWDYHEKVCEPIWPPQLEDIYPEIALRGLATMLPEMRTYFDKMPRPHLDGGYYTKTPENRPLIGPLPIKGAYVSGAVSGFGIMSSCGVGELLAKHVSGIELPEYASAFLPSRYEDTKYLKQLEQWIESGEL